MGGGRRLAEVGPTFTTTYDPRNIACEVGTYDNRIFQKMSFPGKQTVPSLRNNSNGVCHNS